MLGGGDNLSQRGRWWFGYKRHSLPEGFVIGDAALGVVALELVVLVVVTRCILTIAPETAGAAIGRCDIAISSLADTATGFLGW